MASFRKRNGKWQVQIRQTAKGSTSKTFILKKDAVCWAREQEVLFQNGQWLKSETSDLTIYDLMKKYRDVVTPQKRGRVTDVRRLKRLLEDSELMAIKLQNALPHVFASFRDKRLRDGSRTCHYDLVLLRHAWNIAKIEWGWQLSENPIAQIRFPRTNPPRERRLKSGEYKRLLSEAVKRKSWYLYPMIILAVETAMRRGELLELSWQNIDFEKSCVLLPITKNGSPRWVPLTKKALVCLKSIKKRDKEKVFPLTDNAFRHAWNRLKRRTKIETLTFHDLRHEAISQMFESGYSIPQIMAISGHKTVSQLFRYVQLQEWGRG